MVTFKQDRVTVMKEMEIENLMVMEVGISDIDKVSGIFTYIHNENFNRKVEDRYFSDIIKDRHYKTYMIKKISDTGEKEGPEKEVYGYIIFYDTTDSIDLFEIAVDKRKQRKGIGNRLLNDGIDFFLKESGHMSGEIMRIVLEVNENNKNAIKLYEGNGFKKIFVRRNYYGLNQNGIIMEKIFRIP